MPLYERNGLAVESVGCGDPVVLVHGLGGTSSIWEPQVQALSSRFRVLRFDLPGSGRSQASGQLSIDRWVSVVESLLDEHEIERARFAGHSLGTLILQHFAARHPERVAQLALLGINPAPVDERRQTVRDRATAVRANGMRAVVTGILSAALSPVTRAEKPEVVGFVREVLLAQDPDGYARSCEAVADATGADLSRIAAPVLLVAGADDTVSAPTLSRSVAAQCRDARVVVLPSCGHWMTIESHSAVSDALIGFFGASVLKGSLP